MYSSHACAVNRVEGRRKPGAYSGQRPAAGNLTGTVQGGAVTERGSGVRRLRGQARRHAKGRGPPTRSVAGRRPEVQPAGARILDLAAAASSGRGHGSAGLFCALPNNCSVSAS